MRLQRLLGDSIQAFCGPQKRIGNETLKSGISADEVLLDTSPLLPVSYSVGDEFSRREFSGMPNLLLPHFSVPPEHCSTMRPVHRLYGWVASRYFCPFFLLKP